MMAEKKRTSPWVYVGVGCLVAVLAIVAVIVAIGAWGFTQVRQMQRTMEDPVTRTAAAVETLGATALPEGYHAMVALSVPFGVMETTMLTDREPDADGPARIPLYRLVHVQLEVTEDRNGEAVPTALREGPVLAAIYRASHPSRTTGTPREYALRLLVEPCRLARPTAFAAAARN
jgi:hypothetical protein